MPHYAYLDVIVRGSFVPSIRVLITTSDQCRIRSYCCPGRWWCVNMLFLHFRIFEHFLDAPESSGAPQITGSATSTSTPSTSSNSPSSGSSSSKAGPIAGGVVGGAVFIALIAAAAFWWTRRRKARIIQPSQGVTNYTGHGAPTPMSFNSGSTSVSPFVGMPSVSPKLYVRPSFHFRVVIFLMSI